MHISAPFLILALLATTSSTLPNYSDNAYPDAPSKVADRHQRAEYVPPKPTSTPCTTSTPLPTSTTPCDTKPTASPQDAESQQAVSPTNQERPKCPPPTTITKTLPPLVQTATRTVHDVRTATVTSVSVATSTTTVIKPEVQYKTKMVEAPASTVTEYCTKTSTVQQYVTKVKVSTVQPETVTKYKTIVATTTVVREHTVTKTVGLEPTHAAKAPAPAYGSVEPIKKSEYPSAAPVASDYPSAPPVGRAPANDAKPVYMPSENQDSAYGY